MLLWSIAALGAVLTGNILFRKESKNRWLSFLQLLLFALFAIALLESLNLYAFIIVLFLSAAITFSKHVRQALQLLLRSCKFLFWPIYSFLVLFVWALNSITLLTSDRPILKVTLSGKMEYREMTWKTPSSSLQQAQVPCYEVILSTPEDREIKRLFLSGELVGVRAQVLRFPTYLQILGLANRCHLDLVYNGYHRAEGYERYPVEAFPLSSNGFLSKMWMNGFIKTATLESNYFPLVDAKQKPTQGAFLLTLNSGGLSAIKCCQNK